MYPQATFASLTKLGACATIQYRAKRVPLFGNKSPLTSEKGEPVREGSREIVSVCLHRNGQMRSSNGGILPSQLFGLL